MHDILLKPFSFLWSVSLSVDVAAPMSTIVATNKSHFLASEFILVVFLQKKIE
jgi:hypothetical protein